MQEKFVKIMEPLILVNRNTNFHNPRKVKEESEQVNTGRLANNG